MRCSQMALPRKSRGIIIDNAGGKKDKEGVCKLFCYVLFPCNMYMISDWACVLGWSRYWRLIEHIVSDTNMYVTAR